MKKPYPFDPSFRHHLLIALGLAVWIFVFLYFTEPLDVNEFGDREKLIYLPLYGLVGAFVYLIALLFQKFLQQQSSGWLLWKEISFLVVFVILGCVVTRMVYLYVIMVGEPNPYTLGYYLRAIYLPASLTILPIVIVGRWAFGKYANKKLQATKLVIPGAGTYEGLRLFENDLICIQSSDNYIEVTYLEGDQLKKHLIRNKLSEIESLFPQLQRTHRSHLLNPLHFREWKVKSGKHSLVLSRDIEIPVSKSFVEATKARLHSTPN